METKVLVEDGKELEGFKKSLIRIGVMVVSCIIAFVVGLYFFWKISTVGVMILTVAILWWRREELKRKTLPLLGISFKQVIQFVRWAPGVPLFVLILCAITAFKPDRWYIYLMWFVAIVYTIFLYRDCKKEDEENRLIAERAASENERLAVLRKDAKDIYGDGSVESILACHSTGGGLENEAGRQMKMVEEMRRESREWD